MSQAITENRITIKNRTTKVYRPFFLAVMYGFNQHKLYQIEFIGLKNSIQYWKKNKRDENTIFIFLFKKKSIK